MATEFKRGIDGFIQPDSMQIYETDFGNWELALNGAVASYLDFTPTHTLITLSSTMLDADAKKVDASIEKLIIYIQNVNKKICGELFVTSFEHTDSSLLNQDFYNAITNANRTLKEYANQYGYKFIDLSSLYVAIGLQSYRPGKYHQLGGFGHHPTFYKALTKFIGSYIAACKRRLVRLVIVDLDNTLWSGVVGDDGITNVVWKENSDGHAHYVFQKFLKHLHSLGVLLAICSKNDLEVVQAFFSKTPEFGLQLSDFAAVRANWKSKSSNIHGILSDLNLTEQGAVFIDDSPFERSEVRDNCPGVYVPEMPADCNNWMGFLYEENLFHIPSVSKEDIERNKFYASEKRRADARKSKTPEEFLASLDLRGTYEPLSESNLERCLTLLNKTNQFNLTGNRYEKSELLSIIDAGRRFIIFGVTDRFSDYGEVGVIGYETSGNELRVTDWVLSCRAFSRSVEQFMLREIVKVVGDLDLATVVMDFVATGKNKPAFDFFSALGFVSTKNKYESQRLSIGVRSVVDIPCFLTASQ